MSCYCSPQAVCFNSWLFVNGRFCIFLMQQYKSAWVISVWLLSSNAWFSSNIYSPWFKCVLTYSSSQSFDIELVLTLIKLFKNFILEMSSENVVMVRHVSRQAQNECIIVSFPKVACFTCSWRYPCELLFDALFQCRQWSSLLSICLYSMFLHNLVLF